jgi:hypothetical protein
MDFRFVNYSEVNCPWATTLETKRKFLPRAQVEYGLHREVGGKTGIPTLRGVGRRSSSSPLQWRISRPLKNPALDAV